MAARTAATGQVNGVAKKPSTPRAPVKKPVATASRAPQVKKATPVAFKAASVAGETPATGVTSAYAIMASRIANRVAEMAESITFVER